MATITYNIKTDFPGSNATGNGIITKAILTLLHNDTALSSTTDLWFSTDVGKWIGFKNADFDSNNGPLLIQIAGYIDARHITLSVPWFYASLNSTSIFVEWGTDDTPALVAFGDAARADQLVNPDNDYVLYFPNGGYCMVNPVGNDFPEKFWARSIRRCVIEGESRAGVFFDTCQNTGYGVAFGGQLFFDPAHAFHIESVNAGSTVLALLADDPNLGGGSGTIADGVARFTPLIGHYAYVGACDMASFGQPSTPAFWDFVKILSIDTDNLTYAYIHIETPLRFSYKSTYPWYGLYNPYQGGPATLFHCSVGWDIDFTIRKMTLLCSPILFFNMASRIARLQEVRCPQGIAIPSTNMLFHAVDYDCTPYTGEASTAMEYDKVVDTCIFDNLTIRTIDIQSTYPADLTITNSHITFNTGCGGRLTNTITNTEISVIPGGSFYPGAHSYGSPATNSVLTCENSIFHNFGQDGGIPAAINTSEWTMVNGLMREISPGFSGPQQWECPDTWVFWYGVYDFMMPFQILDSYRDGGGYHCIQTSWPGGFPGFPYQDGTGGLGIVGIRNHPAPSMTLTSCTGTPLVTFLSDRSQVPAGDPICSHWQHTVPVSQHVSNNPTVVCAGWLVSMKIEVLTATPSFGKFYVGIFGFDVIRTNNRLETIGGFPEYYVRTDQVHTVIITPNGVSGAVPGDSLSPSAIGRAWVPSLSMQPRYDTTSGQGTTAAVRFTLHLDQEITQPSPSIIAGPGIEASGNKYGVYRSRPTRIPHV